MANLRRVSQNVSDQTMENPDVMGHSGPGTMVANQVNPHLSL
jgi:hypothetical protein